MITLYAKNATDFSHNGLMVLDNYVTLAEITEELNGEYSLEVQLMFATKLNAIENGMVLKVPAPSRETPEIQLYTQTGYDVYVVSESDDGYAQVFSMADEDADCLTTIASGTEIIVTDTEDGWYKVVTPAGGTGYVKTGLLTYARTEYDAPIYTRIIEPQQTREQLFRIESHECELDTITIKARHIFYDLVGNYVKDADSGPAGASTHFDRIKDNLTFASKFKLYGGATGTGDLDLNRKNPVEAILGSEGVVETCGGEVLRDNYNVYYADNIGYDRGVLIAYRKNITGMTVNITDENVATHIIPVGYDDDDNLVYLDEIAVASEHAAEYGMVRAVEEEYRDVKVGDLYADVAAVKAKLRELAEEGFAAGADMPEVEADVDFVDLRNAGETELASTLSSVFVGDTIHLRHENYGFDIAVEVIAGCWDCVKEEWISIELGSRHATLASVTVDPALIPDSSLSGRKIGINAVGAENIGAAAVTEDKIASGAVSTQKIAYGAITADKIIAGAIEADKITAGAITTEKLAAGAVTAETIEAGAITAEKLAAGAVTADTIAAGAITADAIAAGEITTELLAAGAITTEKIAAGAITAESGIIANGAIQSVHIAEASITDAQIVSVAAGKITAGTIDAGVINVVNLNADNLTVGTINGERIPVLGTDKIEDGAISGVKIVNGAVTTDKIEDSAITADKILANAVTAGKIGADAVTAINILAGAITTDKISANAVDATKITAGAITTEKLAAGVVTADKIAAGTITAAKLASDVGASLDISSNTAITAKVSTNGVISAINQSAEAVTISAAKINFNGAVTANEYFKILMDGSIQAIAGTIGGWTITETDFTSGSWEAGTQMGMRAGNASWGIWAGNGKFRVQPDGFVYAENAQIAGNITASAGAIGAFTIGNAEISDGLPNALYTGGKVNDSATATGMSGNADWAFWAGNGVYRVTQAGALYATNAQIAGTFSAGNWTFNNAGMTYANGSNYVRMIISGTTAYYQTNGYNVEYGADYDKDVMIRGYGVTLYSQGAGASVSINRYSGSYNYEDVCLFCDQAGSDSTSAAGNIGTSDKIWDLAWIRYIHYYTLHAESSRTVKHDIAEMQNFGSVIDALQPVSFIYNNDREERTRFGLIYEDTLPIFPEICLPKERENDAVGIDYIALVPVLLNEIKELRSRVTTLETAAANA